MIQSDPIASMRRAGRTAGSLKRVVTPRPDDPGWLEDWPRRNKAGDAVVMWDELIACMNLRHQRCNAEVSDRRGAGSLH